MKSAKSPSVDLTAYRSDLYTNTRDVLLAEIKRIEDADFDIGMAQSFYEVWATQMGIIDALMSLQGVSQDIRMRSLRHCLMSGRRSALEAHEKVCQNCAHTEGLRAELDSAN